MRKNLILALAALLIPGGLLALGFALLFQRVARSVRARRVAFSWRVARRPQIQQSLVTAR